MLFGMIIIPVSQISAQNVIIKFDNGSQFAPLITAVQKITFSDDNMLVDLKSGTDNTYNISDIRKIYFGNVTDNNVPETAEQQKILIYPNPASAYLILANLPNNGIISIYAMDGLKVLEKSITNAQDQIDINSLAAGLYVIKVNQSTLKFIKQ